MFDMIAAALMAALVGMGVGSGGLYILYLVLLSGWDQLAAQGANLIFFLSSSVGSVAVHLLKRRIEPAALLMMGLPGAAGAALGAFIAPILGAAVLKVVFGVFMAVSGVMILFGKKREVAR